MHSLYFFFVYVILIFTFLRIQAEDDPFKREKTHYNKDPLDYTDRDVDSLFEEWEVK